MFSETRLTPFSSTLPWDMAGPVTVDLVMRQHKAYLEAASGVMDRALGCGCAPLGKAAAQGETALGQGGGGSSGLFVGHCQAWATQSKAQVSSCLCLQV